MVMVGEKGRAVGHVVFEGDVVGDGFGAVLKDKNAPTDGIVGNAEEETHAGLAGEVGGFGVGEFNPGGRTERAGEGSDVDAASVKSGKGYGVTEVRAVGVENGSVVVYGGGMKGRRAPHASG